MADIDDVFNALKTQILIALYPPNGTPPVGGISPVAGILVEVGSGWPLPADLDVIAATLGTSSQRGLVSVFAPLGYWRNTTRYPPQWQVQTAAVDMVTATVSGQTVTIGGTVSTPQNVAVLVKAGLLPLKPYVYSVQAGDTLNSIAAALAALINADTAASATGAVITVASAAQIKARVGGQGTVIKEVMRQIDRIHMNIWCPSPALGAAVAAPVKAAISGLNFLTLVDQMAARVITCGEYLDDMPEKPGLFRRCIMYDIEYPTTITEPAYEIIVPEEQLDGAQTDLGTGTTIDVFY